MKCDIMVTESFMVLSESRPSQDLKLTKVGFWNSSNRIWIHTACVREEYLAGLSREKSNQL
jgi:hypothetical protein